MAEDTTDIESALDAPKQVSVDGVTVTERSAEEILALDRAKKAAALSTTNCFRRLKLKPPGADG